MVDGDRGRWRLRLAFYSLLIIPALPLIAAFLVHRLWIRRKGLPGLGEKLSGAGPALTRGRVLVHGVSLGEVNLMRPLLPGLEAGLGGKALLTSSTTTGRGQLDKLFADHERAFFPLDLPWAVWRFLARARPRLAVMLEFELWPLFLCAAFARGVPVVVVNAKVSVRSFRRFKAAGALVRPLFRSLALVLAQNGQWGARLIALGVRRERLVVTGSMKADIVSRATPAAAQAEAQRTGLRTDRPLLLLASTSAAQAGGASEERSLLAGQLTAWRERGWQVAICPRHPERGGELATLVRELGATPRRTSSGERLMADGEVVIIDEIGHLAALYALTAQTGGIAVVGGSLGSGRGGQNMLEAAAHGCCTVVGWDTRNFPDAMELLRVEEGVVELEADEVQAQLRSLVEDADRRGVLGMGGERAWAKGRGATARAVAAIAGRLGSPS